LTASTPAIWYQIHITAPGLNVTGLSIAGLPFVVSGRNDDIAWGVTNAMIDDVDFIVERVDQSNPNYYLDHRGERKKFVFLTDTIRIAGSPDSIVYRRYTTNSAVISDVHLFREPEFLFRIPRTPATKYLSRTALTFRWTARSRSNEVGALLRLNTARVLDEAEQALLTWHAPAFNFHLAHRSGEVRTVVAGVIPIRRNMDPLLPSPSWDGRSRWEGLMHLSSLGRIAYKGKGAVASANNRIIPQSEPFVSTLFHPASRAQRIKELIGIYKNMTVRDAQVMQMDVVSPYAQRFTRKVLPYLLLGRDRLDSLSLRAFDLLRSWDGSETAVSPEAAIYAMFLQRMMWNTFEDELGSQLYYDWTLISSNPFNRMMDLLDDPRHRLFDDVRTPQKEDLGWIVLRSFVEAVHRLHAEFDTDDVRTWEFGAMHTVTFPHIMGANPLMRPLMNNGPFAIGGSVTTLMNTEWAVYDPFKTKVTVSARVISDLADSVQYTVIPGGASGQPLDAHYSDQTQLWLRGGYVQVPTSPKPSITFTLSTTIAPERSVK
jgi:penicillin G amidase